MISVFDINILTLEISKEKRALTAVHMMSLRELFVYLYPQFIDNINCGEIWDIIAQEIYDKFSTGSLPVEGRKLINSGSSNDRNRGTLIKIPTEYFEYNDCFDTIVTDILRNNRFATQLRFQNIPPYVSLNNPHNYCDIKIERKKVYHIWPKQTLLNKILKFMFHDWPNKLPFEIK